MASIRDAVPSWGLPQTTATEGTDLAQITRKISQANFQHALSEVYPSFSRQGSARLYDWHYRNSRDEHQLE